MNKFTVSILIVLLLINCNNPKPESFIPFINGYWEIDRVILKDGTEKVFKFNQNIDFFEINNLDGVRKKVKPTIDGKFIITKDSETFSLKIEKDSLRIHYKTLHSKWKETFISVKEDQMIIKNESGNLYFYRPYKKLDL